MPNSLNSQDWHNIVVIGAGGSGLSVSYHLRRLGLEHVVLERGQTGNTWSA
ncbi:MAG: NAD(P)-binding protein [Chloroflexi bacterium]|nr:NAD(P)-binding protein [Chloroflexota bacterium]